MRDTAFCIENDHRRVLFHPRNDGQVNVCFLDKVTEYHKHKVFRNMVYARAMGKSWCNQGVERSVITWEKTVNES